MHFKFVYNKNCTSQVTMTNDGKIMKPNSFFNAIMLAVTDNRSARSTFEKLVTRHGQDFMKYPEFEIWYNRFAQKMMKKAMEKEKKEKMAPKVDKSEQRKLEFSDLSMDVISRIVDKLDVPDRLHIRHTSKPLQDLVDSQNPKIRRLKFQVLPKSTKVFFVDSTQKTSLFKFRRMCYFSDRAQLRHAGAFLEPILKMPKLKLAYLELYDQTAVSEFVKILERRDSKLHVEHLSCTSNMPDSLLSVLLYVEPRNLKNLEWKLTKTDKPRSNLELAAKILETDHWKHLESFKCPGCLEFPDAAIQKNFGHLASFEVLVDKISMELLVAIRDNFLSSAHFQSAVIHATDFSDEGIREFFRNMKKLWQISYEIERDGGKYLGLLKIRRRSI